VFSSATAHIFVDVDGWFPADTDFTSLQPERLLDTRSGIGAPTGVVPARQTVRLDVTGVGVADVPDDASAVVLNVTAVQPSARGWITVFACGESQPTASNLNYNAGQTAANAVFAEVGEDGEVCLYTESATHILADVAGWFPGT
jgi:hypothetical protein